MRVALSGVADSAFAADLHQREQTRIVHTILEFRGIRFMKSLLQRAALCAALIGTLAVCGVDSPSAPAPALTPDASLLGGLGETVNRVLAPLDCPTKGYESVTQRVGSFGGTIKIGPHTLRIPAGALSGSTEITATAPKGKSIEVQFQPEGLEFLKKADLTLSYKECSILVLDPKVVYVDDNRNLLEVLLTFPDLLGRTATGKLDHFSGYMLWD